MQHNVRVQVAARAAFKLQLIFDNRMARNRGSPATSCYEALRSNALTVFPIVKVPSRACETNRRRGPHNGQASRLLLSVVKKRGSITPELTGHGVTADTRKFSMKDEPTRAPVE